MAVGQGGPTRIGAGIELKENRAYLGRKGFEDQDPGW